MTLKKQLITDDDFELKTKLEKDIKLLEHRISANTNGFECIICWNALNSSSNPVISTCCWQLFCYPCSIQYFTRNNTFETIHSFPSVSAPCCRKELLAPLFVQYSKSGLSKSLKDSINFFAHVRLFIYAPYMDYDNFCKTLCSWAKEYDLKTWANIRHKAHVLFINDIYNGPKIVNRISDYIDIIMIVDVQQVDDPLEGILKVLKRKKNGINIIHFYAPMTIN